MKQPRVYIKKWNKVREVEMIDFYNKQVLAYVIGVRPRGDKVIYSFDDVEFIDNTGMKDKNGKYIYVGDIVKDGDDIYTIKRSEVYKILSMSNKKLSIFIDECICREIEVIGNVYKNKELLKC